jgi:hypothetical protein
VVCADNCQPFARGHNEESIFSDALIENKLSIWSKLKRVPIDMDWKRAFGGGEDFPSSTRFIVHGEGSWLKVGVSSLWLEKR